MEDTVHSSPGGNGGSDAPKGDKARSLHSSSDMPYFAVATNHVPNVSDCAEHVELDEYLLVGEDTGEVEGMVSGPLTLLIKRVGIVMLVMVAVSWSGSSANLSCAKPAFCSSICTPTIAQGVPKSVSTLPLESINEKCY